MKCWFGIKEGVNNKKFFECVNYVLKEVIENEEMFFLEFIVFFKVVVES